MNITKTQLLTEPPGPRRVQLALWRLGMNYSDVARRCNCNKGLISQVVRGLNSTTLHTRIRAQIVTLAGIDESWLFEQPESENLTAKAS